MNRVRNSPLFIILMIIGDVLAVVTAYVIAYILRVRISDIPPHVFISARDFFGSIILLLVPFTVIWFSLVGLYRQMPSKRLTEIGRVLIGAFGALMFMVFIDYFYNDPIFPAKLVPIYGFIFSLLLISLGRGILYFARFLRRRKKLGVSSIMIIGDNDVARIVFDDIESPNSDYKIHSVIGDRRKNFVTHRTFAEAISKSNPTIIIQIATPESPTIDTTILNYAQKNFISFKFVPSEINDIPDRIEVGLFMGNIPMMSVSQTTLLGWARVGKRIVDVAISGLALLILSPILLIVAILNKIIIGHIFFFHNRLTRGDQIFPLIKFQTVRADLSGMTPEEAFTKIGRSELIKKYRANGDFLPNDPRYGTWSKFLRKTSIDELPQLWNVFRGDISLVGPRALAPEELNNFHNKHTILNVKSGVTGLAQISGRRDLPWEQRRKLDVYYVQNWSFGLDIAIMWRTFWQVLFGRGAK